MRSAKKLGSSGRIHALLHSIAYGNLKPIAPPADGSAATALMEDEDMARTIYAMGTSLLSWTRETARSRALHAGRAHPLPHERRQRNRLERIRSRGRRQVVLESVSRAIAVEYGAHGLRCNVLQPGVTDTPALRLIPGNEQMKAAALARNPLKRLTQPETSRTSFRCFARKRRAGSTAPLFVSTEGSMSLPAENAPLYVHGVGHFHPDNVIDNAFLTSLDIGTDEAWIRTTGSRAVEPSCR